MKTLFFANSSLKRLE